MAHQNPQILKHQIAQHLLDVHNGDNWTSMNLANALKYVEWKQASIITPFYPNSIAMLLHHITYWNRVVAQRGKSITPTIHEHNGMIAPPINSKKDWEQLQHDNFLSANELATVIEGYDAGNLFNPILTNHSSAYKNFTGQVEHVHYHLGQIVIIKKYIGNQLLNK